MSQVEGSDSLGHLCRQLGSAQAHMGFGGAITLKSEMSQLSIDLTFSPLHSGQVRFGILSSLGLLVTDERAKGSVPFGVEPFRFRQGPTAREAKPSAVSSMAVSSIDLTILHPPTGPTRALPSLGPSLMFPSRVSMECLLAPGSR